MPQDNRFSDLIPGYEQGQQEQPAQNRFADLVPGAGQKSVAAWQDLSFPKKLLATAQAGASVVGDVAGEIAGGYKYVENVMGQGLTGNEIDFDRAAAEKARISSGISERFAPDDPAEAQAKERIMGMVGEGIETAQRGARGAAAQMFVRDPERRAEIIDQPMSDTLGNAVMDATGDPADATMAYMLPAVVEGIAGARAAQSITRAKTAAKGGRVAQAADEVDLPDVDEIKRMASQHYDQVDNAGIRVSGEKTRELLTALRSNEDVVKGLTDRTIAALNKADEIAEAGDLSFKQLEQIRRVLKKGARSIEADDARTALQAAEQFDRWVAKLKPADLTAGDGVNLSNARKTLTEARSLYHRARRAEDIAEMFDKASVEADGLYTGAGFEHALRKQFRQLYNNKKKLRMWPQNEQQMIRDIATGRNLDRVLRTWGRMAPTGAMNAWLTFFAMSAHPVAGAVAAGAGVAKKVATRRSIRRAEELDTLIRSGAGNE